MHFNQLGVYLLTVDVNWVLPNVLQLQEVGGFYHKCSYEERMFVEPQNCHTKH